MYPMVILLACASLAMEEDQPYCAARFRRLCQGKGRHVACQFPTPGPGLNCRNYTQIDFTKELRHFITHYINRRRQRIAAGHERVRGGAHLPRPQIMMFVEWDRELATLAQRLADQCSFVHDDCRATVRYPYAGQSVGEVRLRRLTDDTTLGAQRAIRRVLDAWWGERRRVEPQQVTQPFKITSKGSVWGHFSQIAVWTLRAVGCGAVRHGIAHPRLLLVCDFSHTNMLGQRTLTPGKMATCPEHTRRRPASAYPLLCASVRYETYEEAEHTSRDDDVRYDEEYDSTTEITTSKHKRQSEALGLRRMPHEDKRLTDKTTTEEISDEDAIESRSRFVPVAKENVLDFTPNSNMFYNKLADKLGAGKMKKLKGDHVGQQYSSRRIVNDEQDYRAGEGLSAGDMYMKETETIINEDKQNRDRTRAAGEKTFTNWLKRKPSNKKLRDPQEDSYQPQMYSRGKSDQEYSVPRLGRPVTTEATSAIRNTRARWKQTRDRPRRPGAVALLQVSASELPKEVIPLSSAIPFRMDAEDVDQLFKDTGFHPAWRATAL